MARFYGTLQGARGPTSRLGHASSGLEVTAQSYQGDIVVALSADGDKDMVGIYARDHGSRNNVMLFYGAVADLITDDGHKRLLQQVAERQLEREYEA